MERAEVECADESWSPESDWCLLSRWAPPRPGRACAPAGPGSSRSRSFDAARYSTRFAGEVPDFDPLRWIEKKEVKKCARFIQFAIAATAMAMEQSGLRIDAANADPRRRGHRQRHRRVRGDRTRASHPARARPRSRLPVLHPLVDHQSRRRARLGAARREGAELRGRHRLHHRRARHRRRVPADQRRLCRRDDLRRRRSGHHAARGRRVRRDAGAVAAQRRPRARQPALGRRPRRLRRRRRRRHPRARGADACDRARRADPGRARRLRHERRCPSSHRAARRRRRCRPRHAGGAGGCRDWRRRTFSI